MDDLEDKDDEGGAAGGGFRPELIKSYLAFAKRALRSRWRTGAVLFTVGLALTIAANKYLPRTYSCTTVMMVQGSSVLEGRDATNALAGASSIIARHENLEGLIRDIGLVRKAAERRPPLLALKDKIVAALFGKMDSKTRIAALVGTLETKIDVTTEKGDLSIKVQWSDPQTATELAEAARESFLKARHSAEISAFEDKMAILDGHATELRDDIGGLVQQLKAARDERVNRERDERNAARKAAAAADPADPAPASAPVRRARPQSDAQLPELKEKLSSLRAKLSGYEADRERRVRDEQAKYDEMKLRLTSNHPAVVTQAERIQIASQVPSDVTLMRAEVKDLEGEIQQREAMLHQAGDTGLGGGSAQRRASTSLPADVTDILERTDFDPALTAQLSGAVARYGSLRNDLFSTRVDLDTAQAAFNHRYQVIIPAEAPNKADKPKSGVVIGAGLVLTLLLSLLSPILAELRTGIIRERWQVEHFQLPVLAELQLPPHSPD